MAAVDQQYGMVEGLTGPADNQVAITPSDTTDLAYISRALFIGGAGNIVVTPASGQANITYTVPAGMILPIRVSRVIATGTTATNIVSWY
jgi:hypothetical protein